MSGNRGASEVGVGTVIYQHLVLHIVILLQNFKRRGIQRNIDRYGMSLFGLPRNVRDALAIAF